jgi:hypothetical protein
VFDNLGYHDIRSSGGLVGNLSQKVELAFNLVGVGTTDGAIGARAYGGQMLLLLLAGAVVLAAGGDLRRRVGLALAIAVSLGLASFLPTPTWAQYFSGLVPFLAVAAAGLVAEVAGRRALRDDPVLRRVLASALGVGAAIYLALGIADAYRYATVAGSEEAKIGAARRVAEVVQAETRPGERVLSSWPGYLFETHARPVRGAGLANFALVASGELSPAAAGRDGVARNADIEELLRSHGVRVVVQRPWFVAPEDPDWAAILRRTGYRERDRVGSARIYVLGS